jgi:hypothetical protein
VLFVLPTSRAILVHRGLYFQFLTHP